MNGYLIELSVIHLALTLGYWFFLRKEQQYATLRMYLIGSVIMALIIPLIKLPGLFSSMDLFDTVPVKVNQLDAMTITATPDRSIRSADVLVRGYIAISVFLLFRFFSSVIYLIYLERKSNYERYNNLYIRKVGNIKGSFTFFNWIFLDEEIWNDQPDYDLILQHEKAHVTLGHTYDLIFFELFKICFWWLPSAWFINGEIRKIHEYQADARALKSCSIDQYSSILIGSTLKLNKLRLANSFHDGLILKRLKAMKQQAKNVNPWKWGALGTLCVILFMVFACREETDLQKNELGQTNTADPGSPGEIFVVVEDLPQYPGGMDAFYKYMMKEIRYPKEARVEGVEGRVDVQFVVEKDGSLSDVRVVRSIGEFCDNEAIRVVKNSGSFKPGMQAGRPVRVRMVMPIIFQLDKNKRNEDNTSRGAIVIEKVETIKSKLTVDARYGNGEWTGRIFDEEGEGLPGATIVAEGTTYGTVSGPDGAFNMKALASDGLRISFVGYESVRLEGK